MPRLAGVAPPTPGTGPWSAQGQALSPRNKFGATGWGQGVPQPECGMP